MQFLILARTKRLVVLVLTGGFSLTCFGQIGSHWNEVHPRVSVQLRGSGPAYQKTKSGIEIFSLTNAVREDDERAEQRVWNDYSSGTHQFEGYLTVTSLGGNAINLKQTFESGKGAWFLCTIDKAMNGTLRNHQDKTILATNVLGRTVRVNTIHDMDGKKFYVYVDGVLKETVASIHSTTYNDKYGTYRAASGYGPITVEWSQVRFWEGGTIDETSDVATANTAPPATRNDTAPAMPDLMLPTPDEPSSTAPAPVVPDVVSAPPQSIVNPPPAAPAPAESAPAKSSSDSYVLTDAEKQFLDQVAGAVANNDTSWIADHMIYPLSIVANDEISVVGSKEGFKKVLARRLTDEVRSQFTQAVQGPFSRNWQGVTAGDAICFTMHRKNGETAYGIVMFGGFAFQPDSVPQNLR